MAQLAKALATKSYSFIMGAVVVKIINFCKLFSYLDMSDPPNKLVVFMQVDKNSLGLHQSLSSLLPSFLPFLLCSIIN